jgi:shikimate kinase
LHLTHSNNFKEATMTALEPTQEAAIQLSATTRRLILTGFMGAGKTTTGVALAARLGWTFLDLDRYLEHRAQATIPDLFTRHGESHFRRLESSALASALAHTSTVIALGGGTPEIHANRLLLEQTPGTLTIFLDAPFPVLFDRCIFQAMNPGATDRPVLKDPAAAEARFRNRLPHYRRLAHLTQQTEDLTAQQTVTAILRSLASQKI